MLFFKRKKEEEDSKPNDKKESRRSFRLEKIELLIGIALVAYFVISSGGAGLGGILDKVKGFF